MKALAVAAGGLSISQAASAPKPSGDDPLSGASVTASYGVSESSSASKQITERTTPSRVLAGGTASIIATGGDDSNITITGSDIEGEDIDLKADKDIILRAAREHNERQSSNESSSASAGLSLSLGNEGAGASVVGNANQSKGKSAGTDHLLRPTNITAKKELNIRSGRDMTMEGAKAKGEKVTVDVARNLTISTPQERRDYESQQSSSGSATSIPIPVPGASAGEAGASASYGKEKIDSRFRSVDERSGIEAGDEGFAVAVQGKTKLTGAVIASTDQAVTDKKNRFESAELELIDVVNQAEYRANAVAINAGVGSHLSSSGGGVGRASGAASSITRSGISGIAGDKGVRTGDKSSGITPIFDEEAVKKDIGAQVAITQEFSKQASKVIGDYAAGKLREAAKLEIQAANESDPEKAKALQEEAKAIKDLWAEGGALRVALHTIVGGLTGNVAGAAGAGISQAIIPTLGEKLAELDLPAPLEQALIQAVALGIGAAAGGNAGAAAAESATTQNFLFHAEKEDRDDLKKKGCGKKGNPDKCTQDEIRRLHNLNELDGLTRKERIESFIEEMGPGVLSAGYESDDYKPDSINARYNKETGKWELKVKDPGGFSYGLYQMSSEEGTIASFFKELDRLANGNTARAAYAKKVRDRFVTKLGIKTKNDDGTPRDFKKIAQDISKKSKDGDSVFVDTFKEFANHKPFIKLQHHYIEKTHYQPAWDHLKVELNKKGIDAEMLPLVVQDIIWSISVQHGGANNVIDRALKHLNPSTSINEAGESEVTVSDELLIRAFYEGRKGYVKKVRQDAIDDNRPGDARTLQKLIDERYPSELNEALKRYTERSNRLWALNK